MPIDKGFESFKDILENKVTKKAPAYPWQDLALAIIDELAVPGYKRNSVFLVCKQHPRAFVEKCLNDTKELCQTDEKWKYFFKLAAKSDAAK
ncbi:MAG: hypothetical protein A2744_03475 [Candidatus Buchananbacteria bacterium RIFCSPHIGHO2_01_FULL_44_11]|uniref:Uncharacterized protein n=1 Tax=Candidatus Buchananbacteria bacterium RIFCSPHIGHO2_01_FULL_44_11 TaxID=1797535 RepID=A0A1G1Y2L1_9BACT|nr:MAG: hypothetical protein A2744_03475 [Candidatus Buchananbacteria bacterium RIFCSPHIGHO2_01_FULL_44_11]